MFAVVGPECDVSFPMQDIADSSRIPLEWVCREKEEGQSTCVALTKLAKTKKVDLLVVGSFGRKGEKL